MIVNQQLYRVFTTSTSTESGAIEEQRDTTPSKSPMLDALDFLQKLFEQSIEERILTLFSMKFFFSKKEHFTFNQYQDIFSNVSHENNEMIYSRILSYVEENFYLTIQKQSEYFLFFIET